MDFLEYEILDEVDGLKIRDYLKYDKKLSSRFIKQSAIEKRIFVNNLSVKLNYYLKKGDKIKIKIHRKNETQSIVPIQVDFEIVYEDSFILIVNKPKDLVVYPSKSHDVSLSNGIMYYFKTNNIDSIVRPVNRLDMNTTGLLVIAKNQYSHMFLSNCMIDNIFYKEYIAIVQDNMKDTRGIIEKNIFRPSEDSVKRTVHDSYGKFARTIYEVVKRFDSCDLVRVKIETGRTHQIRVHMSYLGNPIVGDKMYGSCVSSVSRYLLHAYKIKFPHPYTNDIMEFKVDIPSDMMDYIKKPK
ncbi:Ribosomal large subunit pseudouridine synthase D [Candidatus Arthromitus sp. SFB-mouse-NL]|uniref:RluA family pseudouridine synthase n=1 Tax=Candidatus Arthromitus sp. SFB-mouse-NL TaxID=1508644 RepID=UPI000499C341|nr:RluA family pseudouridine synthase [Candidatus Arthromitus sp. SFB-mouse-NL]AID44373.1 Ribosomal large subunit pseudouridine synthase D [Candidatus Arthromitus sp. SFB-mouse-NL]